MKHHPSICLVTGPRVRQNLEVNLHFVTHQWIKQAMSVTRELCFITAEFPLFPTFAFFLEHPNNTFFLHTYCTPSTILNILPLRVWSRPVQALSCGLLVHELKYKNQLQQHHQIPFQAEWPTESVTGIRTNRENFLELPRGFQDINLIYCYWEILHLCNITLQLSKIQSLYKNDRIKYDFFSNSNCELVKICSREGNKLWSTLQHPHSSLLRWFHCHLKHVWRHRACSNYNIVVLTDRQYVYNQLIWKPCVATVPCPTPRCRTKTNQCLVTLH